MNPVDAKVEAVKKKLTGLEDILAGIEAKPAPSPTPPHADVPLMGDTLPIKLKELSAPRVVSVEASLLANLDELNLKTPPPQSSPKAAVKSANETQEGDSNN